MEDISFCKQSLEDIEELQLTGDGVNDQEEEQDIPICDEDDNNCSDENDERMSY